MRPGGWLLATAWIATPMWCSIEGCGLGLSGEAPVDASTVDESDTARPDGNAADVGDGRADGSGADGSALDDEPDDLGDANASDEAMDGGSADHEGPAGDAAADTADGAPLDAPGSGRADAGDSSDTSLPPCTAESCPGACCGKVCVRSCASCPGASLFCEFTTTIVNSNGYCVSTCGECDASGVPLTCNQSGICSGAAPCTP